MIPEWLLLFENVIWFALAAMGFALLFNVPNRTVVTIAVLAALGGMTKILLVYVGVGIILASLAGATLIGILSVPMAHVKHTPSIVMAIPAIIPMVPGVFSYRMMLGVLKLVTVKTIDNSSGLLVDILKNALNVAFITMALVIGVSIPFLISREKSGKFIKLFRRT